MSVPGGTGADEVLSRQHGLPVFATVFAVLLALYLVTLAPDITLWDSGEFNAAAGSLGIPHPPGTPLFILIARAWSLVLGVLPQALAVNALSAVASAAACAFLAGLVGKWTANRWAGIAGGLIAGATFAVWQNATETEVYALSFLLAVLLVVTGERAGSEDRARYRVLLAYLLGLAVAVQISALVAAPAAVFLAASPRHELRWPRLLSLGGVLLLATGIGVVSQGLMAFGLLGLAVGAFLEPELPAWRRVTGPAALALVTLLGASATLFMLVRAGHDPGVNQGNPETWQAFVDVIARRQYDVPPLWPRRAPIWIQIANFFQYADWQIAFGLDDSVAASWRRTPWSVLFAAASWVGARWQWRRNRHSALAMLLLLGGASLGVIAVLNLRAGPTIGIGVLPPDAPHEPRERDYFFALAFATAAVWAGIGAMVTATKVVPRRLWLGAAVAALPVALNWSMANRRREPDAALPRALGAELLRSAPPRGVLLLAGDNDSYATWYQQQVRGLRSDVTPITIPLLGARWYREELARRDSLLASDEVESWAGEAATIRAIGRNSRRLRRPVAAALSVSPVTREIAGHYWILRGLVFVEAPDSVAAVDREASLAAATRIGQDVPALSRPARDPTGRYVAGLLACPRLVLEELSSVDARAAEISLDSRCNLK